MRRWWVVIVLLLSVGINVGLLAALAGSWWAHRDVPTGTAPGGVVPAGDIPGDDGGQWPGAGPGPGPSLRGGPPLERVADHLGLEGEVRERFLELQRSFVRDMAERRLRRLALDRELRRELTAGAPDEGRIGELTSAKAELFLDTERATARTILETRRLLNPEQQRRYLHVLQRLRGGPGAGPGMGPGSGPGPRGPRRLP